MAGNHKCAVEDCLEQARPGQLMCLAHWRSLPKPLQRDVNHTWARYRYEPEAYREARQAAVDHFKGRRAQQGRLL